MMAVVRRSFRQLDDTTLRLAQWPALIWNTETLFGARSTEVTRNLSNACKDGRQSWSVRCVILPVALPGTAPGAQASLALHAAVVIEGVGT